MQFRAFSYRNLRTPLTFGVMVIWELLDGAAKGYSNGTGRSGKFS